MAQRVASVEPRSGTPSSTTGCADSKGKEREGKQCQSLSPLGLAFLLQTLAA